MGGVGDLYLLVGEANRGVDKFILVCIIGAKGNKKMRHLNTVLAAVFVSLASHYQCPLDLRGMLYGLAMYCALWAIHGGVDKS